MEIKVPILGTHIDIIIDNVLSGRNDHWTIKEELIQDNWKIGP